MAAIREPLAVGAEIRDRRLDLHDHDLAVGAEAHQVGAAPGRERQFAHRAEAERTQQSRRAARHGRRRGGAAAVEKLERGASGGVCFLEQRHRHSAADRAASPAAARSGKAAASAARSAAITPRSVTSPVISRAGVTSKA